MTPNDRNFVAVLVLAVIPIVVYWDTMFAMTRHWSTDAYRHGYLIPFLSTFLLWHKRPKLFAMEFRGSWVGAALLVGLVGLWLVATATSVQLVAQTSVVMMVSAFVLTVAGWKTFHQIWFPLAYLLFAVPIGDTAVPFLMDSTASIAVVLLQMLGVPALREGMLVFLPGGTFEVVEACSGFSYLNAGVALGVLVAHLMFRSAWKQLCYVAAVVSVFILVNGMRAFVIMFVGSMSNMKWLVGEEHILFGWVLFLIAMVLMYWLAEKYSDRHAAEPSRAA